MIIWKKITKTFRKINPFLTNVPILYPPKISERLMISTFGKDHESDPNCMKNISSTIVPRGVQSPTWKNTVPPKEPYPTWNYTTEAPAKISVCLKSLPSRKYTSRSFQDNQGQVNSWLVPALFNLKSCREELCSTWIQAGERAVFYLSNVL